MKFLLNPSLMCMDFLDIKREFEFLNKKVDMYHFDIMDGHYVHNITLSPCLAEAMAPVCDLPMDFHLLVTDPEEYIEPCRQAVASMTQRGITSYYSPQCEVINGIGFRIIDEIKDAGFKAGIAVNPETPVCEFEAYLDRLDLVTFMSVDPGFAGQAFIPEVLDKVAEVRRIREADPEKYHFIIQIDGQCNAKYFKTLYNAGIESFIVGNSGLFKLDPDIDKAYDKMMEYMNEVIDG